MKTPSLRTLAIATAVKDGGDWQTLFLNWRYTF